MKVLIASITASGILRVRSELIQQLRKEGHDVFIVSPLEHDYLLLEEMGCKVIGITIQRKGVNPIKDFSVLLSYYKILKTEKPDVVLLFSTKPNIYCGIVCRLLKIPVIMNITGMGSALGGSGQLQLLLIKLYRFACNGRNIKRIFFQNIDSMHFFSAHKIGEQSCYVHIPGSGINLEKFPLQDFPQTKTVDFLFVARIMKLKGINEYIESAHAIKKLNKNAVFHVLGDCDEEYESILREKTEAGVIIYHGRVNNIIDFEKMSQCTIQPSYYPEGMSNVILEAAASGRAVITTDHPGCREGVDDGISGYIVPPRDSESLTKAIQDFLNLSIEARKEMGLNGRKKMEREFDRNIIVSEYIKAINN